MSASITIGLRWFIALDVAKVLAAAAILPLSWKLIGRPSTGYLSNTSKY
jgi:hypothetical protein